MQEKIKKCSRDCSRCRFYILSSLLYFLLRKRIRFTSGQMSVSREMDSCISSAFGVRTDEDILRELLEKPDTNHSRCVSGFSLQFLKRLREWALHCVARVRLPAPIQLHPYLNTHFQKKIITIPSGRRFVRFRLLHRQLRST